MPRWVICAPDGHERLFSATVKTMQPPETPLRARMSAPPKLGKRGQTLSGSSQTLCHDNGWSPDGRSECSDDPLDELCGKKQEANAALDA